MRTPRPRPVLAALILALLAAGVALAQEPPPGYRLLATPGASGALLLSQRGGAGSATQLLLHGLREVTSFFDGRPRALGGFAEMQDQWAEAGFQASSRNVPLTGVGFAMIGARGAAIGFAFDAPNTFAQSLPRLLQLAGGSGGAPACGPSPQRWQLVAFPDGSGQMELPEGWRITGASQGAASAEGPQGLINRAMQTHLVTRATAAQSPGIPFPVADPTDPLTPLLAVWAHIGARNQQQGLPAVRVTRVLQAQPAAQPAPGFLYDVDLDLEVDLGGRPYRAYSHVIVGGVVSGSYLFQESNAFAPSECFAEHLPTLLRILGSARTASHVTNEILQHARQSQREAHDIWWDATRNQDRARDRMHSNWTEAFRGTRIVEDTRTGTRSDVRFHYSADVVRRLNQQEGYERYREIPLRDLNQ